MNSASDPRVQLENILDALADSILEAPSDEILGEVRAEGLDPESLAADVRKGLLSVVSDFRRRRLQAARRAYEEQRRLLEEKHFSLPESPTERRTLLASVLARQTASGLGSLTAQYRDLQEMTDDDVRSLLLQLAELGALDSEEADD